jgi:hypothetical protein
VLVAIMNKNAIDNLSLNKDYTQWSLM